MAPVRRHEDACWPGCAVLSAGLGVEQAAHRAAAGLAAVGSTGVAVSVDSDISVATDSGGAGGSSAMTIGSSVCVQVGGGCIRG